MLKYATVTDNGDRKSNEDYLISSSVGDRQCFVVCDGVGGCAFGDIASSIAGNAFVDELYYCNDLSSYLLQAYKTAQNRILSEQKRCGTQKAMKSTAVCMATDSKVFYVGNVGDSRFYAFKKDGTYIRTCDHSIPQLLVQSGKIPENAIRNHPNRSMLLKVLGEKSDEQLCDIIGPLSVDDFFAFLICSDGFWELIDESEMIRTLKNSSSPKIWLEKMVEENIKKSEAKNKDNYTAIAIIV